MDKNTIWKVIFIMAAGIICALLIRGILLHGKKAGTEKVTEPAVSEHEEKEELPYAGKIIVIDAGHGGVDPGKVGVNGAKEKDINLEIALILKESLEEVGFTVVMTRQNDTGFYDENSSNKKMQDLKGRLSVIEEAKPELVVSIHQNSFSDPSVYGPQVFYYESSEEGAVAAKYLQDALNRELEIARPRVQKANDNYFLLTRCSAIMVIAECGFLSNREEEALLQDEDYRRRVAEAIRKGICDYLDFAESEQEKAEEEPVA